MSLGKRAKSQSADASLQPCSMARAARIEFKCRPTLKGLLQQLDRMARHFQGHKIKLCYEASYVDYCLQRDLISNDIHCDIVSPSSIPSPRGKAIKTDRIDAGYLAQFYANDLLTIVQPPYQDQEQDRDLLRSRQKRTFAWVSVE